MTKPSVPRSAAACAAARVASFTASCFDFHRIADFFAFSASARASASCACNVAVSLLELAICVDCRWRASDAR